MSQIFTRRAALALGAGAALVAAPAKPALLPIFRRSRARFAGWRHINITKWRVNAPTYPNPYPSFYSTSELDTMKGWGLDHVRFAIAPDPMIAAQVAGDTSTLNSYIDQIINAGAVILSRGLYVNFDMHFNASSVYNSSVVLGSSNPQAAIFQAYKNVCLALAARIAARFTPEQAMFEPFNEPPTSANAYWCSSLAPYMHDAIRAVAPNLTLVWSGGDLGNLNALVTQLDPSLFKNADGSQDYNVLYSYHYYDASLFTNCARPAAGSPTRYYKSLPFPSDGMDLLGAIADATANINADGSLSAGQKTATIAAATTALTNYRDNITYAWHVNELQRARRWADVVKRDASQLYRGEYGVYQDLTPNSTTDANRAAWLKLCTDMGEAQNERMGIWCYDQVPSGDFGLFTPGTTTIPDVIKAAVKYA